MIEEKKCPKCGKREKVKNGFMKGKQRYKCKCCGCNYIGSKNGYPDHIKQKDIKYYLEAMDSEESNDRWVSVMYLLSIGLKNLLLKLKIFLKDSRK